MKLNNAQSEVHIKNVSRLVVLIFFLLILFNLTLRHITLSPELDFQRQALKLELKKNFFQTFETKYFVYEKK